MGLQKLAVSGGSVLAALIGVDQQLVRFNLALTQGPIKGLQHQQHLNGCARAPADDAANEPIHPHRQVAPARCGADVRDVACPATVGAGGVKSC